MAGTRTLSMSTSPPKSALTQRFSTLSHQSFRHVPASPYARNSPPKPTCDNDDYNFAFSLIQQGSAVKNSFESTKKLSVKFETGLQRLSDFALLSAYKAKVAAKAAKELENRLWVLRAEEYRRTMRYMEASRDMIGDQLSSSSYPSMQREIGKPVDPGDQAGEPLPDVKILEVEMGFYSKKADDYLRITTHMDWFYGTNAEALTTLQLQIDILMAHIRKRSVDEVDLGSDSSSDEPDPSSSDPLDIGEDSPDTEDDSDEKS